MLDVIASNPYVRSLIVLGVSIVFAKVVYYIIDKWVRMLTKHTKTDIDDALLDALEYPVYLVIVLGGLYKSLVLLPVLDPYLGYVKTLAFVVASFSFAWILQRVINVVVPRWLIVGKSFEKTPRILSRVLNGAFYFIALLMVLSYLGIEITPLLTTLGIGGIAVGLALQDTLSNFFAGLHIISDKPINIGDFIELEGTVAGSPITGFVEDIGWRSTKIKTLPNNIVIIPNAKLAQSIIINDSLPAAEMNVVVQCGVSYEMDLAKVEKVAVDAAREVQKKTEGAVRDFEPFIRFHSFGDSNINFSVILKVKQYTDKFVATHELIMELKKRFDRAGIKIAYPTRRIIGGKR